MAAEFDAFAASYDRDLERGLALTGEGKTYFARRRLEIVRAEAARAGVTPERVLDFGCGTGTAAPLLREVLGAARVTGVDPSAASIARAREEHRGPGFEFLASDDFRVEPVFDLVFVNGVFHHIPVPERPAAMAQVAAALRPGGLAVVWENNPLNPGTRLVMSRVAFDRDAVLLRIGEVRRLMTAAGLRIRSSGFHFVFPRFLAWFRPLEPALSSLPLGGQYLVVAARGG